MYSANEWIDNAFSEALNGIEKQTEFVIRFSALFYMVKPSMYIPLCKYFGRIDRTVSKDDDRPKVFTQEILSTVRNTLVLYIHNILLLSTYLCGSGRIFRDSVLDHHRHDHHHDNPPPLTPPSSSMSYSDRNEHTHTHSAWQTTGNRQLMQVHSCLSVEKKKKEKNWEKKRDEDNNGKFV